MATTKEHFDHEGHEEHEVKKEDRSPNLPGFPSLILFFFFVSFVLFVVNSCSPAKKLLVGITESTEETTNHRAPRRPPALR
jgi:hypothetical protein